MARTLRRQLERFHAASRLCHWCRKPTVLKSLWRLQNWGNKPFPDNMATIDHLHSKMSPLRSQRFPPQTITHVLACRKCNQERSRIELKAKLDLQRIKSGHSHAVGRKPSPNLPDMRR